ncbi:hypothetical protein EGJ51_17680 [Pseudomonas fulva]|uniref:Uncharacterized protein n=1 Tax=Pseudomonas parafulva TaxID=157782 RepID=A0AAJ0LIV7_9PSED|nr:MULTISPECIES: PAAR domain-containing protein [Pseudomonas]KTT16878.1 hypothetical protein NS96R_14075 [Pseudomonas parafulva]MBA1218238.1 hypothetical protein [Pseudomonas fulva]RRW59470.1 hypothetical protein EGJ51_17680 [Pseudomonas fulva]
MPGAARVGIDTAGGVINGNLAPTVLVNGAPVAVVGAGVSGHGVAAHAGPVMVGGSGTVFACGLAICRAGDAASCTDTATGSANVLVG